jgi:ABC-type lipoprotein release transport system permease subunit
MVKYIKLAWRNMWRNWRRTLIAASAIVLGIILLILMDSMIRGSDKAIFGNAVRLYGGNVQVHAPGYRDKAHRVPLLPLDDAEQVVTELQAKPGVVAASKRINTGGMVSSGGGSYPVVITAIEPSSEAPTSLIAENMTDGRFLSAEDGDAVIIGQELADLLGVGVGDRVTVLGRRVNEDMRQRNMNVVGIYDLGLGDAEKGMVFVNLPTAQTLYNLRGEETEITVLLDSVGQEAAFVAEMQPQLPGYEVDSWDTLRPEIGGVLGTKAVVTQAFGLIVLLIASIGILNLMMMAVYERTREMGVLAALGMKGREIMGLFLLEGAFIGGLGAFIGVVLGWALVQGIAAAGGIPLSSFTEQGGIGGDMMALMGDALLPAISFTTALGWGIAVMIIAALASLIPAWQAAHSEPAEALHHV